VTDENKSVLVGSLDRSKAIVDEEEEGCESTALFQTSLYDYLALSEDRREVLRSDVTMLTILATRAFWYLLSAAARREVWWKRDLQ